MTQVINGLTYRRFEGFWENVDFGIMAEKLRDCRILAERKYNEIVGEK